MYKKIVSSSLVAAALMAVNGCGGGGSSVDSSVAPAALSGVGVDDLILNGIVQATDTDGNVLAEGRSSITDGSYTLNVTHTGVVLLNVTCDENSTMYNPVTTLSSECGSDVNLNSITSVAEAGQEVTVNISPLTEIVYQVALTEAGDNVSGITEDDFDTARAEIGVMLSVDPIADDPLSDDYAKIIDVIHTMAETSTDPDLDTVMEVTDALADALSDGVADGEEVIMDLVETMAEANLANNLVDSNGTYTPPEEPAQLSDIDAAKALFTELRTQAMSVTDYTNSGTLGFLDTEALDMEQALNGVVLNIDFMEQALNYQLDMESFMRDTNLTVHTKPIGPTRTMTLTLTGQSSYSYIIEQNNTTPWEGTVSYPDINGSEIYTFPTLSAEVDGTFPLSYESDPVAEGVENSQSFNGSITVTKTSAGTSIAIEGTVASNGTSVALSNATAELAYDENTTTGEPILNYFQFKGATLQGIVGGYTIDGSVTVNSYVQNAGLEAKGGIEETAVSGVSINFTCSGQPLSISDVSFTYDDTTYTPDSINIYQNNAWFGFYNIAGSLQESEILTSLTHDASCASGSLTIQSGDLWTDTNTEIANSGWLPNDITFVGTISRIGASIKGTLNAKWTNASDMNLTDFSGNIVTMNNLTDEPLVDITLNGTLQIPDRPEMLMSLTFENNATNYTLGASYTYDTTVINAEGIFDTDMLNGDVAITTHTGLRADIRVSNELIVYGSMSNVTKDGRLLGEFEDREGFPIIKYIDGSFESIF